MELEEAAGHRDGTAEPRGRGLNTPSGSGATPEHLAAWLAFVTSPAAPKQAMSALELEGYLTGVVVCPSLIPPSRWMAGLWGNEEPVFESLSGILCVRHN